jgi:hypothetical protein
MTHIKTQTEYLAEYAAFRGRTYDQLVQAIEKAPLPVLITMLTDFCLWLPQEASGLKKQLFSKVFGLTTVPQLIQEQVYQDSDGTWYCPKPETHEARSLRGQC